jgi:hypothetical protein
MVISGLSGIGLAALTGGTADSHANGALYGYGAVLPLGATATPTPCSAGNSCQVTPGIAIVPGTVDTGNHCDDCTTNVALPFPFSLYGASYTSVNVSSNGNAQFVSTNAKFANVCLPVATLGPTIFAYWEDLVTEGTNCTGGCGIYTSISGSAPNRIFNIEWRTFYFSNPGNAYFEIRLYENPATGYFDIILGEINTGATSTIGVQNGAGLFTQCVCNTAPPANSRITFTVGICGTPTRTPTAVVTGTPETTVTPCVITFLDVLPTDYFYEAVRYLFCNGVISGYGDNTFRPYANTTRGQLTKIVVLAFGIPPYTPPTPTFTDVPTTHTFYQYIETAAYEGLVSGYADGTFRPQNDVTRGQLCKIVVEAAGWPLVSPPTPTFTDVPTDHTFYQYVETAFDRGIISGYSDGTFRPGNNATRGQISKVVYETVIVP